MKFSLIIKSLTKALSFSETALTDFRASFNIGDALSAVTEAISSLNACQ